MEPASAAEEWREERDIEADEQEQRPGGGRFHLHRQFAPFAGGVQDLGARGISCSNSLVSAEKSAVAAELRG